MSFRLREWLRRLYCTITRQYNDSDEELRFHLAMAEEEAGRRGESQRDARIRVGGIAQSAEAVCDQRSIASPELTWLSMIGPEFWMMSSMSEMLPLKS